MQAKAAVLYKLGEPVVIENLTVPDPSQGQVLVKVAVSGVCHTQLLEVEGKRGNDPFLPHCLGHEGSGVVEAVGAGVTRVKIGDHVILSWIKTEGLNAPSSSYYKGDTKINGGAITTFMSHTLVSENRLVPIGKDVPFDKAAVIGCAFSTGAGAVLNTGNVQPGNTLAIFGVGGVGLSAVQGGVLAQAKMIVAVDISDKNLERAKKFGATHTINPRREHPVEAIKKLTDGAGLDFAVEAAGQKITMEHAYESIRLTGGTTVLVGNLPFQEKISIDPFHLIWGKKIVGSWGGGTVPIRDFPRYIDLYLQGKLKLDDLITHRVKLEAINDVFALMNKGEVGRAIIEF